MDGFIIINKEKNVTSHTVCHKVERLLNASKCGHSGTLDPNTTGVLVVGVNKGTKLMPYLNEHDKKYVTTIILGQTSDTLDITGILSEKVDVSNISNDAIILAINTLSKTTKQIPPMYSSIKIEGKKLYEYARKGVNIDLEPRDINIYASKLLEIRKSNDLIEIDIELYVSKGFYVRSYAKDLGNLLNTKSLMKELNRVECGQFKLNEAYTLNDIFNGNYKILTFEEVFYDFDKLIIKPYLEKLVKNGIILDERQIKTKKPFFVYNENSILLAIYDSVELYKYKPIVII